MDLKSYLYDSFLNWKHLQTDSKCNYHIMRKIISQLDTICCQIKVQQILWSLQSFWVVDKRSPIYTTKHEKLLTMPITALTTWKQDPVADKENILKSSNQKKSNYCTMGSLLLLKRTYIVGRYYMCYWKGKLIINITQPRTLYKILQ